jgi:hypothetical protein
MPRYELRNTADNSKTYVEGSLPLNLSGLVPVGTYRARVMSDEEPTDIVIAATNPDFTALDYASPGSGDPNELTLTYTYGGSDALVAYGVTSTEATPPGADAAARRANIIAGTGTGNLEEFSVDPFSGSTLDLIAGALTASSESATYAHIFIQEKNNGGFSEIRSVALSNLDFTPATLSTAEATNANTVVLTFTENVFGSVSAGQFAFDIDGVAATITNAVRSGATVTLTVSDTILAGDVLDELSYTPGTLADTRGNPVAAFSGEAITNSITSGVSQLAAGVVITPVTGGANSRSSSSLAPAAGTDRCAFLIVGFATLGDSGTLSATWGSNSFTLVQSNVATNAGRPGTAIFRMNDATLPGTSQAITVTTSGTGMESVYAYLVQYENVNQTTPTGGTGGVTNNFGTTDNPRNVTVNIATATSVMLSGSYGRNVAVDFTLNSGPTLLASVKDSVAIPNASLAAAEQFASATGNLTHTYTASATVAFALSAVEIRRA